jgi:hypothetical protein
VVTPAARFVVGDVGVHIPEAGEEGLAGGVDDL